MSDDRERRAHPEHDAPQVLWSPAAIRVRQVVNVLNLATPLGLLMAAAGRSRIERGPHGLLLARDYRLPVPAPKAPAVTVGDVVLLRLDDARLARRPRLLDHEARHSVQYACWIGPLGFLPAYLVASVWSWLRTRDFAVGNAFERRAGLADGGYRTRAPDRSPGSGRRARGHGAEGVAEVRPRPDRGRS